MKAAQDAQMLEEKLRRYLFTFLAVFAVGMLAHILGVTHDVINHDSIYMLDAKGFYWLKNQGKWAAGDINAYLSGKFVTASWFLPVGLAFFAAAACLIAEILRVKKTVSGIAIGAILVTYYAVMSMTVYYGTGYFGFCFFLAVLGAYFIALERKWYSFLGIGLIAGSMGGYQPYIGAAAAVLVLECICDSIYSQKETSEILKKGIKYIVMLIASVLLYYAVLQYFRLTGFIKLLNYQNIDQLGGGSIPVIGFAQMIVSDLMDAYGFLFRRMDMPYSLIRFLNPTCGIAVGILFCIVSWKNKLYQKWLRMLLTALLVFVIYPIAANLVVVLSMDVDAHDIMKYTLVLLFIVPVVLADRLLAQEKTQWREAGVVGRAVHGRTAHACACTLCAALALSWACVDNDYYRMMIQAEEQMRADCVSVMSAVYAHDDYEQGTEVALIGKPPYKVFENKYSFIASDVIRPLHH